MKKRQMRKACANCKNDYLAGDRYCRFCGAPMGSPVFIEEHFAVLYGPEPIKRIHECDKCGYTWETNLMIDEERWCPKCGGGAPVVRKEDDRPVMMCEILPPIMPSEDDLWRDFE